MSFYKVLRVLLKPVVKILFPTEIVNLDRYNAFGSGEIICNHYSRLDGIIPTTDMFKKELNVVAKAEAFDSAKIAGWFLRKMGGIAVRRGEADIDAVKAILKVLREDRQLLIFPEGTRNKAGTKEFGEFKTGAARFAIKTKKQILPMLYYGMPKAFKRNYLYIGEPISLEAFYGARTAEDYNAATAVLFEKMTELRRECDEYVENRRRKK